MKLALKIKLLPTAEQRDLLLETIRETNTPYNAISDVAWSKKLFNRYKLHHGAYHAHHPYKTTFKLSSQIRIRSMASPGGSINSLEKSNMFCLIADHCSGLKPSPSLCGEG